jgi:hypothetical protein
MKKTFLVVLGAWFLAGGSLACSSDFSPSSHLADLRVLALIADPLEVGPSESLTIRPVLFVPDGDTVATRSWSFCPFSTGARAGYTCAVPQCAVPLDANSDGSVTTTPGDLLRACVAALAELGSPPSGVPSVPPETIDGTFSLTVTAASGAVRTAVVGVPLWTAADPPVRNSPPRIARITIADAVVSTGNEPAPVVLGSTLTVTVETDRASLDEFVDTAGRTRTEDPIVSFFATAGSFDADLQSGSPASMDWTAQDIPMGTGSVQFYAVVRDGRGGQAVAGPYEVPLQE